MWRNAIRLVWSAAFALCYAAYADPARQPVPAASAASAAARHRVPGPGFAPDAETMFAFVVTLVPPGPDRARRAIAILDRQLAFQRRVTFYPVFAPTLQKVVDQLPPRESTLFVPQSSTRKPISHGKRFPTEPIRSRWWAIPTATTTNIR
jgi:hypothetical protein